MNFISEPCFSTVRNSATTKVSSAITTGLICVSLALNASAQTPAGTEAEKYKSSDLITQSNDIVNQDEIDAAYDSASALWLQFFGEQQFVNAGQNITLAIDAMRQINWLPEHTDIAVSMLDARGNFAKLKGQRCIVHINIDNRGSSPAIAALGNYKSSITFVAAHEIAHCRFDLASMNEKFPDLQTLRSLKLSYLVSKTIIHAFNNPQSSDSSNQLIDAYDEALADTSAAMALRKFERPGRLFGGTLENAEAIRLGELFWAKRHSLPPNSHQGGFVFEPVARLKPGELDWKHARRIAIQSVLASTFFANDSAAWLQASPGISIAQEVALSRRWRSFAVRKLKDRNVANDEARYLLAINTAIFDTADVASDNASNQTEPFDAIQHWKSVAWQSTDTNNFESSTSRSAAKGHPQSSHGFLVNPRRNH
jgi:hypothetical protein